MTNPIAAGELNREITLVAPSTTKNQHGESIPGERNVWIVPAKITQRVAATADARVTYTVTIRHLDDLTRAYELETDTGIRLVIQALDPQPQIDAMILTCSAAQRAG